MMKQIWICLITLYFCSPLSGQDWAQFLGPDCVAKSADTNIPVEWDESNNRAWNVKLPGTGSSSPIIVGDQIIVVCYVAKPSQSRKVISYNKSTGAENWSVDYPIDYEEDGLRGYIQEHGYASNTSVSDGESIFVFLGKGGVHAISLDGKKGWSFDVGKGSSNRQWGSAASLLLYKDKLIVNASEEAKAVFAINKKTGREVWKQEGSLLELAYGTPRVVSNNGVDEIVLGVPTEIWSLYPETGKLRWIAETPISGNVSPSIIVDGNTVYGFGGYRSFGSIAVKSGGKGDVTKSNVSWTSRATSYVATPLLHEGNFYWIDDRGMANCSSAETGEVIYRERVSGLSGRPVYASPVLIDDKIYVVTRRGGTIVYSPGDTFEPISRNEIAGDKTDFNASPAVSDGRLYLRSNQGLYCIEKK